MAWACGRCGSGHTLRLSACPRCGSTEPMGRTAIVPKVTAHGGPSDRNAEPGEPGYIDTDDDGGEGVSPGTSSSTSSETPDENTTSGRTGGPTRARTTGNRSSQGRAARTTAGGTGSSGRGTG